MNQARINKQDDIMIQAKVLDLMNMTQDELSPMVFEGGLEYLEKVFGTDSFGMEHIPKTAEYWAWWKIEWDANRQAILGSLKHDTYIHAVHNVKQLRQWYAKYHEASMANRYMTSSTISTSVQKMIKNLIDRERNMFNF